MKRSGSFGIHVRHQGTDFAKGIQLDADLGHLEGTLSLTTDSADTVAKVADMLLSVAANLRQFANAGMKNELEPGDRVRITGQCNNTGHRFHSALGTIVDQAQNGELGLWAVHTDGSRTDYYVLHETEITVIDE